nr:glycosyltransferase N-terminal domain-containing protein [Saprospiraceae bacterium]
GYEVRKNYSSADYVVYLPLDTPANARDFMAIWQPALAVFVKYEFWYFHLKALQQRGIPVFLVSALFRPGQLFFKPYGGPFRQLPGWFHHIFVQNESSGALLRAQGLRNFSVAGDTRIDRVLQIAVNAPAFPVIAAFKGDAPLLVAGSTWPEDEALLVPFLNDHLPKGWKAIIAPHQISDSHIQGLAKRLQGRVVRYSEATTSNLPEARILLIDNVGMLSALYQYGRLAYIGGGFGAGIHNTLEPIAFGLPVFFGPKYDKFEEARYLVQSGGGFSIRNLQELKAAFDQLIPETPYLAASEKARQYVLENQGASRKAVGALLKAIG